MKGPLQRWQLCSGWVYAVNTEDARYIVIQRIDMWKIFNGKLSYVFKISNTVWIGCVRSDGSTLEMSKQNKGRAGFEMRQILVAVASTRGTMLALSFNHAIVFTEHQPKYHINISKFGLILTVKMIVYFVRPTSTRPRTCRRSAWCSQSLHMDQFHGNLINTWSSFRHSNWT